MWLFKKSKTDVAPQASNNAPSFEELSYAVAYFVLPHCAFKDLNKAVEIWTKTPSATGPVFYRVACQMQKVEPDERRLAEFRSRHGSLPGIGHYYLLEYPKPAAIDLSDRDPIEILESGESFVLAPYFSVIVQQTDPGIVRYYVLGQSPFGGGTTLRFITPDGANANLGPGPSPTAEDFLQAVANITERKEAKLGKNERMGGE